MAGGDDRPMLLLVVEDNDLVREVLAMGLEDEGFVVREAADAVSGLAALRSAPVAALVTDVELGPGGSGLELAAQARAIAPDLPVLVVSGRPYLAAEWQPGPRSAWLGKPFDLHVVAETVRKLLDGGKQRVAQG